MRTIQYALTESFSSYKDNIAIEYGADFITYSQLDEKSSYIANDIINSGIAAGSNIGIYIENKIELIAAVIGVIKARCVFVPLSSEYPDKRTKHMIESADVHYIIMDKLNLTSYGELLNDVDGIMQTIVIDDSYYNGEKHSLERFVQLEYSPEDSIYIYFTSGTTGKPKGILGRNISLLQFIKWEIEQFQIDSSYRISQLTSQCHDPFLRDIFVPLCTGAAICIPQNSKGLLEHGNIINWLESTRINLIHCTPSLFEIVYSGNINDKMFSSLKYVFLAGERVIPAKLKKWYDTFGDRVQLVNLYGPTETTLAKLFYPIQKEDCNKQIIPIGQPIKGARVIILNDKDENCKVGQVGEIYIRTPYRTHGYYNNAQLTKEKFIQNPFSNDLNDLIYKTGDLGKLLPDGNIEFIGRVDRQVKIRGYRVELEEIEKVLMEHQDIESAVVLEKQSGSTENFLCAYYVEKNTGNNLVYTGETIREYLRFILPSYMIPIHYIKLDEMPLNNNRKIDYKLLQDIPISCERNIIKPRNEVEEKIAAIWREVLNIDQIGIDEGFFNIGGHSLNAMRVLTKLYKEFNINISLSIMFQNPTIEMLAKHIKDFTKTRFKSIDKVENKEYYELSSAQKRIYVLNNLEEANISYNITNAAAINGDIDISRFELTLRQLIDRHEALRTSFALVDGVPMQKIHDSVDFSIEHFSADEDEITDVIKGFIRPFKLNQPPLMRTALIKVKPDSYVMAVDMHHIIADGTSMGILIQEFVKLYNGEQLKDLAIQYKEFAAWQNNLFESNALAEQENYWKELFKEGAPVLNLPVDFERPIKQSFEGDTIDFNIPVSITNDLKQIANDRNVTLNMLLFSVFSILLSKYSKQEKLIIGSLIEGRNHADLENIIGVFPNFLPIKVEIEKRRTFSEVLDYVKKQLLCAYENQDYPFEKIVEIADIGVDYSRNPLFDTMLIFHNQIDPKTNGGIDNLQFHEYDYNKKIANLDIKVDVYLDYSGRLSCKLQYSTALFKTDTINRMKKHFLNIIDQVIKELDIPVYEIELTTAEEKNHILNEFNDTKVFKDNNKKLYELFEEHAEKSSNSIAVVYKDKSFTYKEINIKANKLARVLIEKGIGEDDFAGILMERSELMLVSVIAVWKAGGAYIPIDTAYPNDRISDIMSDSGAKLLIVNSIDAEQLDISEDKIIDLSKIDDYIRDKAETNIDKKTDMSSLAYAIYTSGSTGKPKGAMVEHCGMMNHMQAKIDIMKLDSNSVISQNASHCFDISVWQFFCALALGGKTVIIPNETVLNSNQFISVIENQQVDILEVVPSYLLELFEILRENKECFNRLKYLMITGEELKKKLVETWFSIYPHIPIINAYGPTEASDDITHYVMKGIPEGEKISIGKPIQNLKITIVTEEMKLCPIGIYGELCVEGIGVGRGYINRKELTEKHFCQSPFTPGERMYKTGDLARWLPDGNIEFLGRMDSQVKVRGFRIELGEIEIKIQGYKDVNEAAVIVRKDNKGENCLCAYIKGEKTLRMPELKEYLAKKLPYYMIPALFIEIDEMPLNANGKIDRKALLYIDGVTHTGTEYIEPQNELEKKLADMFCNILGLNQVGINDNFFELGGHSLKAMNLAAKINNEFNVEFPLGELFKSPTVGEMSIYIQGLDRNAFSSIKQIQEKEYYSLSSSQKRMYMLQKLDVNSIGYNMPGVVEIEGRLDTERLEQAFKALVERHDGLRTSFDFREEDPIQKIHKIAELKIQYIKAEENQVEGIVKEFVRPFDLSKPPLLRVGLIELHPKRHILIYDMHHIISDGVSKAILLKEFADLYEGRELPELKIQYKDYAAWQDELFKSDRIKKQEEYWLEVLKEEIPILNLPTDYSRPAIQSFEGDRISFELDRKKTGDLVRIAKDTGSTMYMVLLSAFNILLSKYSGQEDIVIGSPIAGRSHADLENVIGIFINTLVMRNHPDRNISFSEFLQRVKENSLKAYENQDYQFEELVDTLNVRRDMSRNPIFDVMFIMQNMHNGDISLKDLRIKPYKQEHNISVFDLIFEVSEADDKLVIYVEFCTKLFKKDTIKKMTAHFERIVEVISKDKQIKLKDIDITSQAEKKQILESFNDTYAHYPLNKTVHELFEEQVEKTPDNVAVIFEDNKLTYKELNQKSNQLARELRNRGVRADSIVGIMVERSLEMVVGIMGILKAGGAYLPISPDYPPDRIEYILEDSGAKLLLTQTKLADRVNIKDLIDLEEENIYKAAVENLDNISTSTNLAYVIYTSGSTGKPKGTMIEHHSLINRLKWMQKQYPLCQKDVILQKTTYTFDVSVWELIWWSLEGAAVCMLSQGAEKDPQEIVKAIEKHNITVMHFVPSMLNMFLEHLKINGELSRLKSLRQVFASGEALTLHQVEMFNRLINKNCGTLLANLYGPTEAAIDVSYFDCTIDKELDKVPIGKPIDNIKLYIVDKNNKLQPVGVSGELCIAGVGLARGYLNRPELTAEKFVNNPFEEGTRMYKTGDLAKWLPDGNIEFLGRIDDQVKIRGFRIELGEVENALNKCPYIKDSVIIHRKDNFGVGYLAAYIAVDKKNMELYNGKKRYKLPNNMSILHLNRNETDFMYKEIFEDQSYFQYGIEIKDNDCVFDIGANIGMFTLYVNGVCENANIYAFEPIPKVFEVLDCNCQLYTNGTKIFNYGISDTNKETTFTYYPKATIMSGCYGNTAKDKELFENSMTDLNDLKMEEKESVEKYKSELIQERFQKEDFKCQLKTLSEVIKENNIEKIDLLKIDVEKSEMDVLMGIHNHDWAKIKQIVIEVHEINGEIDKITELLNQNGYVVFIGVEEGLENSGLYTVYAKSRELAKEAAAKDVWNKSEVSIIQDNVLTTEKVRNYLLNILPDYMIPSYFIQMDKLPLTANGKVDRKALPEPDGSLITGAEFEETRNETEAKLVEIWREVLGVDKIGINDNFFELGGHSLKAISLAAKIHKIFDVEVPLSEIFKLLTVKGIAEYISSVEKNMYTTINAAEEKEYYEASSAQKRMYTLQQIDLNSTSYNMPGVLVIEGMLDIERLREAFKRLIQRHEAFRTGFELGQEGIIQKIYKEVEFKVEYVDLQSIEEKEIEKIVSRFIRSFDLNKAPLLRVGLVNVSKDITLEKYILMYDMHHIISDGISMEILVKEFVELYSGKELAPLRIQYKDFAEWQNKLFRSTRIKKQEEYWLSQFAGDIPVLNLPTDYSRPAMQSFEGDRISFELEEELTEKLRNIARETGSTMYMVMLAAFNILLSKYSGQEDIVVGTPIAGRPHADLENIIGIFVNTLAMRNYPRGEKTAREFIEEVKNNALKAYDNQDYQFEELVEKLNILRDMSRNPLFDIMFAMQNITMTEASIDGLKVSGYKTNTKTTKFDLMIEIFEGTSTIVLNLSYLTKLFNKSSAYRILENYKDLLWEIVKNTDAKLSTFNVKTNFKKINVKKEEVDFDF